ncbi:MAG: hypothetical protein HC847_21650 [Hydrococcus sp. RU_2_2]|nr:hypothetical protein [Hydrococcus sp. RU_2_2]NJP22423.1 hypothetical protein [Hydrococcus sp. CRU_1_1]
MPKPLNFKCLECSRHTTEWAQTVHGEHGDSCWNPKRCYDRRSFYRHRSQNSMAFDGEIVSLSPPDSYYAILYLYKDSGEKPLHALGAELWLGQKAICKIEPIHCFGLTASKIKAFSQQVLQTFSEKYQIFLPQYKEMFELSPQLCPLRPCPLNSDRNNE